MRSGNRQDTLTEKWIRKGFEINKATLLKRKERIVKEINNEFGRTISENSFERMTHQKTKTKIKPLDILY